MKKYCIGTDRVLAKLDSPVLDGWITVSNVKELQTYADKQVDREKFPAPVWTGSKFPADLMKQVIGTIHEFPRMETAYSLYYNVQTKEWAVKCPEQNGAGASVSYGDDGTGMPEGFSIIGSIHTHPEMGAFWSGTDLNDQQKKHGIHFVFGLHDGLVRYSKVTVFTPTEQFDQDIHNVVEDFDWAQVYPAVPEWVETIKKQSYRKPVPVYTGYSGYYYRTKPGKHTSYGKDRQYPSYGGNYSLLADDYSWWDAAYGDDDDYDYPTYTGYSGYSTWGATGSTVSVAASGEISPEDNKYITVIDEALTKDAQHFREALLDTQTRSVIEYELDIVIVDTSDKLDTLEGVMEIADQIPRMEEKFTNEEQKQMFEAMFEAMPEVNLIESTDPSFRNHNSVDTINWLINGLVDALGERPFCIDKEDLGALLDTLKDAYETILQIQAEQDASIEDAEQDAEQC